MESEKVKPIELYKKYLKGCVVKVIEWPARNGKDVSRQVVFSQKDYKSGNYVNISLTSDDLLVLNESMREIRENLKFS